jgi:hypothetical protein
MCACYLLSPQSAKAAHGPRWIRQHLPYCSALRRTVQAAATTSHPKHAPPLASEGLVAEHCPFAVAYVKYDKASSAALAMEALNGEVLNNGRGPKLKVLLAEAPTAR